LNHEKEDSEVQKALKSPSTEEANRR